MRIGIQFDPRGNPDLEAILSEFSKAEEEGFETIWIGQVFDHDILTLYAMAGLRTERIELGTSVVPLPTRHPTALAQQALTTQLATGGRLCLGVGCGHAVILDRKLGLDPDRPLARTREALEVLQPLLRGDYVKYAGTYQQMRVGTPIAGAEAPPVILAALGPRMIELAGELTDGVTLVFAGAGYVAERVRPLLPETARIVASLPVVVTDRSEPVKSAVDFYTQPSTALPNYQRVMEAQKAEKVSGLSVIGSVSEVEDGLGLLAESGVTDLNPILLEVEDDPGCSRRTREFLAARARG
ncbi:LLM class flavin-dependent oxidoreductase [Myxococcota bacterium]|nr:LLM class flavin-dependent oxidoreductase [Myxococcota bacterium]